LVLAVGLILTGCKGTSADSTISSNVKSQLSKDSILKDSNLAVDTEDGVVTISGTLKSESERSRAVELARQTDGVTRVIDKLEVNSETTEGSSTQPPSGKENKDGGGVMQGTKDLALAADLKTKFAASKDVSSSDLDIDVKDGVVTLSAEPGKHPNLKKAAEIARDCAPAAPREFF